MVPEPGRVAGNVHQQRDAEPLGLPRVDRRHLGRGAGILAHGEIHGSSFVVGASAFRRFLNVPHQPGDQPCQEKQQHLHHDDR